MSEYRVEVKVKNNLLLDKIEKAGYKSISEFCREIGVSNSYFGRFINMQRSIYDTRGNIRPSILKISEYLKCLPEELFTANQAEAELKTNKRTYKVAEAEIQFFLQNKIEPQCLEDIVADDQKKQLLENALETLTRREKKY